MATSYRLTPSEYEEHLRRSEDPSPTSTMKQVRCAGGEWIVDGAHGTASYDDGWYWVRTRNLRLLNWG